MHVIAESDVALIETPGGNRAGALATPRTGAVEVSVIRQRQSPGGGNPPHWHDREEVIAVLRGQISVTVESESRELRAGDSVIISARSRHQIENVGEDEAEWLLIAPAGIRFFHANGEEAHPAWSL